MLAIADAVINARLSWVPPSAEATVLAWAGGVLHASQLERALAVLDTEPPGTGGDVLRFESLVRLADPASPRLAEQVGGLAASSRRQMAAAVQDAAADLGADPGAGLPERVAAWQAVHRVRADIEDRERLIMVQSQLVHGLEALGDPAAAYDAARTALAGYSDSPRSDQARRERYKLQAAVLRLARAARASRDDPVIETAVASALAGGAAAGLEARIWAAIDLLDQPGRRQTGFSLAEGVAAELDSRDDLGRIGDRWRLLLAFHAGRAGYPAITQRLLTPMLTAAGHAEQWDAARAVLVAVAGPQADTRLEIAALEAALQATPDDEAGEEDRLRLHNALGSAYARLGDYRRALSHAQQELPLRERRQGPDHPRTLTTRSIIATWTGQCGDTHTALNRSAELLPDLMRVLGPDHPDTLTTRNNIATWTGRCGDTQTALRLFTELLPDQERVLGPDHPETLTTRNGIASCIGQCGDTQTALRLLTELLPDQERVLCPDHPETLTTRNNIAGWTGRCGDAQTALRLFTELLPDRERVLGPDHPQTLATRADIAYWTWQCGDAQTALRLLTELLPGMEQALGPDHPIPWPSVRESRNSRRREACLVGLSGSPVTVLAPFVRARCPTSSALNGTSRSPGAVFAGGGRCWVRINVG